MDDASKQSQTVNNPSQLPTLSEALRGAYMESPRRRMIIEPDESMTYAEVYWYAGALAHSLHRRRGLEPGDTIVLAAGNTSEYIVVLAAAQMLGARIALVPPALAPNDMRRALHMLDPKLAIMESEGDCAIAASAIEPSRVLIVKEMLSERPQFAEAVRSLSTDPDFFLHMKRPFEVCVLSSGSTGAPKVIVQTGDAFMRNAIALQRCFGMTSSDVVYVPVPFAHVFGIVGLFSTVLSHATLVSAPKYHPDVALALLDSTRVTIHLGVATMFLREFRRAYDEYDLSALRAGLVAGAGCPASVIYDWQRKFGCTILQSYGMSETAATLTLPSFSDSADVRAHCVGSPVEGARVTIAPDTGEILCMSPSFMVGILDESGEIHATLDENGWFHTGDIGEIDAAGNLTITGRIKDMIIRGGINIFPAEIEQVYDDNPYVAECCAVGYADPELGERTCLCTLMAAGDEQPSSIELRNWSKGRIEKCKVPDVVLKMEEFPHLGNGKIDKIGLKDYVARTMGANANVASRAR